MGVTQLWHLHSFRFSSYMAPPGWQKLAAIWRGQKWPLKLSSNAYLLFCDKCVVFGRNCKFANLTQYNMQYKPCNSAPLAQETLFLTQRFPKIASV